MSLRQLSSVSSLLKSYFLRILPLLALMVGTLVKSVSIQSGKKAKG